MNTKQFSGMWSAGVKITNYCNRIPLSPPIELLLQVKAVSVRAQLDANLESVNQQILSSPEWVVVLREEKV